MRTNLPFGLALACLAVSCTLASGTHVPPNRTAAEKTQLEGLACRYQYAWDKNAPVILYLLTPNGTHVLPDDFPQHAVWKKVRISTDKPEEGKKLLQVKLLKSSPKDPQQTVFRMKGIVRGADKKHFVKGDPYFILSIPGQSGSHAPIMEIRHDDPSVNLQAHFNRPVRIEARAYSVSPPSPEREPGKYDQVSAFDIHPHPVLIITKIEPLPNAAPARDTSHPATK